MAQIVTINDPDDARIVAYRDIRERDLIGRKGHFIAEGEVVVRVLVTRSRHEPVSLLLAEKRVAALANEIERLPDSVPVYAATQSVMDAIAGFPMHRGILALGRRSPPTDVERFLADAGDRALVVVLFGIANHDNMGGIFRNAAAFGADGVILDSDCCDPLYRKSIRVSAGNALTMPFARLGRGEDALAALKRTGFEAVALGPRAGLALGDYQRPDRVAVLLGSEGRGLSEEGILERTIAVRIPMADGVDSLNVATASGIALHSLAS